MCLRQADGPQRVQRAGEWFADVRVVNREAKYGRESLYHIYNVSNL